MPLPLTHWDGDEAWLTLKIIHSLTCFTQFQWGYGMLLFSMLCVNTTIHIVFMFFCALVMCWFLVLVPKCVLLYFLVRWEFWLKNPFDNWHICFWFGMSWTDYSLRLSMWGPSYLGLIRSISWLLMPWLLASPGHQQPWYWLCEIGKS